MPEVSVYRNDFSILKEKMNGKPLAYLDTAASAQKPVIVLESMRDIMEHYYANVHRGLYHFSQVSTQAFENVRGKVADFIGAAENEIVFTRNATEGVNLVAQSWGRAHLKAGDEIILTEMEHHANIVPWQLLRDQIGVVIKVIPVRDDGTLDLSALSALLTGRTRMVAFTQVSNVLGTVNPVADIIRTVKTYNPDIRVLIDGSQGIVHGAVDVAELGCDFYVFTGHKLYAPTGVGVLWGKYDVLSAMPPYQGGGDMIDTVSFEKTTFRAPPQRFEAGTPAIIQVIGLGAAVDYLRAIGMDAITSHEQKVFDYARAAMAKIPGLTHYGTAPGKAPILSFTADWGHGSDIAMILDKQGVAVRAGHHCCMPLMKRLGVTGTVRVSIGLYTNTSDIDALVAGLKKAREMLS
jgi:cysteine desulfurase/selenocysteine lyase